MATIPPRMLAAAYTTRWDSLEDTRPKGQLHVLRSGEVKAHEQITLRLVA